MTFIKNLGLLFMTILSSACATGIKQENSIDLRSPASYRDPVKSSVQFTTLKKESLNVGDVTIDFAPCAKKENNSFTESGSGYNSQKCSINFQNIRLFFPGGRRSFVTYASRTIIISDTGIQLEVLNSHESILTGENSLRFLKSLNDPQFEVDVEKLKLKIKNVKYIVFADAN